MKYNPYDNNNVRRELKRTILLLNGFIEEHKRMPEASGDSYENDLNRRWNKFCDVETLTEEEKVYIQNNLATPDGLYITQLAKDNYIRASVRKFVKEIKEFRKLNRRMPSTRYEKERHFFDTWIEFNKPNGLNDNEKRYIESNVKVNLKIRKFIQDFVRDFNNFVLTNKRMPENISGEATLYGNWLRVKNKEDISSIEYEYILKNLVFFKIRSRDKSENEDVRFVIKQYVSEYNDFVEKHKREPSASFENKEERSLYAKHLRYFKRGEASKSEKEYINKNLKTIDIRQFIIDAVEKYNNFIKTYGRKPERDANDKQEKKIFNDIRIILEHTYLSEKESEYIKYELNRLYYVRQYVIRFVSDYKKFVKENGRKPSKSPRLDNKERSLAITEYVYRSGRRKINKHEKDYLLFNGFEFENNLEIK